MMASFAEEQAGHAEPEEDGWVGVQAGHQAPLPGLLLNSRPSDIQKLGR